MCDKFHRWLNSEIRRLERADQTWNKYQTLNVVKKKYLEFKRDAKKPLLGDPNIYSKELRKAVKTIEKYDPSRDPNVIGSLSRKPYVTHNTRS